MTKQPQFKGKMFSNDKPISETVKVRVPYAKLFVILWAVILIPLISYGLLSKSSQNLNFYLIAIHFLFSILFFILIKFSFEKDTTKLYEAQSYLQKKLTNLESLSTFGKFNAPIRSLTEIGIWSLLFDLSFKSLLLPILEFKARCG